MTKPIKQRLKARLTAFLLVFVSTFGCISPAQAYFSKDDYTDAEEAKQYCANTYGWNASLMDHTLEEWVVAARGTLTDLEKEQAPNGYSEYEIKRGSNYRTEYLADIVSTTKKYLGILDIGTGGAAIAALARAEAIACEEELSQGIYNSRAERNGDNNVVYNEWYYGGRVSGDAYPWCAAFVSWCANQCGFIDAGLFTKTAGCGPQYRYMQSQGYEHYSMMQCAPFGHDYVPQPGDIMFFAGTSAPWEHIGIVVEVLEDALAVVEGNCSNRVKENHYTLPVVQSAHRLRDAHIVHVPYPNVAEGEEGIFNFLTGIMGLNAAAACGVLANIKNESDFRSDLYGDYGYAGYPKSEGSSFGLCQWHNTAYTGSGETKGTGRWNDLVAFCNSKGYDWHTTEGQLYFLQYELQHSYSTVWNTLKNVPNTQEGAKTAAKYWCVIFEAPAGRGSIDSPGPTSIRRMNDATSFWSKYQSSGSSSRTSDPSKTGSGSARIQ